MKCIKEKCPYSTQHDFNMSCITCQLSHKSFNKDSDIECEIEQKIKDMIDYIKVLQNTMEYIKTEQNNDVFEKE